MHHSVRLRTEQTFHDLQARQRAETLVGQSLVFADDVYLDHETWIRPAVARLGDVRGRRVLDLGCGHGMAAVVLARRGAQVTGLDLSAGYLAEAQRRAVANGVAVSWLVADAQRLPFADAAFDAIWGNAVLHHLDLDRAGAELRRVLRPDGIGVFCEPWGENPLLAWARRRLPYPGKSRTADEAPLDGRGLDQLRRHFASLVVEGHQLLARVGRLIGPQPWLTRIDARLLRHAPGLWRWCRYVVIELRRGQRPSACPRRAG
ncbi:MAG: methyltransferase domain-containing protein [Gemmataceae bacterium]|nr:methyltransferase domain-containing protein [Gemmataceae bacterium]